MNSAQRPASKRAIRIVAARTRRDPFIARSTVAASVARVPCRDDTSAQEAIDVAIQNGDLCQLTRPCDGRQCLCVRDAEHLRKAAVRHGEAGDPYGQLGALNTALAEL